MLQDLSHIKAFIENSASTIKSLTVSFQLLQPRSPFLEENLAFKTAAFYEWKLEMVFGQKKEKTLKLNSKYKSSMKREFASWVKQVSSKVFFSSFFFWWKKYPFTATWPSVVIILETLELQHRELFLSIFNSHFSHFHHTTIKIGALVVINSEYLKVQPANGGGATWHNQHIHEVKDDECAQKDC